MATLVPRSFAKEVNEKALARGQGAGSINLIPPGIQLLKISSVKGDLTAQDKDPMIILIYSDKDANLSTIHEHFVIKEGGKGPEILAKRMMDAGGTGFPDKDLETLEDLRKEVAKQIEGKTVQVAVYHEEYLSKKSDDLWYRNRNARVSYIGLKDDPNFKFDASKHLKPLTAEQETEWEEYLKRTGKGGTRAATAASTAVDLEDDTDEKDPLEDEIPSTGGPKPITAPKEQPASQKAEVVEKNTAKTDAKPAANDLSFLED